MSNSKETRKEKGRKEKPISLHPLGFEEAVGDLLKVKPQPKRKERSKAERQSRGRV